MIQPSLPHPPALIFPSPQSRMTPYPDPVGERPIASMPAPRGDFAEVLLHHGLIAAAEREFDRLRPRIEAVLHPVA